ncbi:unnamed protein product [Paramecium octaurelia]|uniref:H-type lectin domain-containing protein n=1 Tax=Paramecium octaurelia TaxID=43137 RepID=A0A8S1U7I1_PAROT|nr:unnamed protein product [Paramecium octaurelia]
MFIIAGILCVSVLGQLGYDGYTEWQSGIDRTINRQNKFVEPVYPLQMFTRVQFPRQFSRRPQVLLMHEEIEWNKNRNINYQTFVSDVTVKGFYINYLINGPAIIPVLRIRWVAFVDSEAEVQYVNYQFEDLIRLRQGFGTRFQDFMVQYYLKYPTPRVVAFIVGAEIEVYDSLTTTIQIQLGKPTGSATPVRLLTRDRCHINTLRIAYFISSDYSTIMGTLGSSDNYFNQFLDTENRMKLRVQRFEREVPSTFIFESHQNVLAQGITGFDVHSRAGNFYVKVGGEYVDKKSSTFHCAYGTRGDTVLQYMEVSYILHPPALPPYQLLVEENATDNQEESKTEEQQLLNESLIP